MLLDGARLLALLGYVAAQILVLFYAAHRYQLLWRWRHARAAPSPGAGFTGPAAWPVVTVQLPVYNEARVVERLIDAAAALRYPAGRLEIQVLDDSTDETRAIAAAAVARHRARGIDIHHLCRPSRAGFKAGALAAGLARARGELLAIFDADFVPPAEFLERLVPRLTDPAIGMVQARWGHLNRRRSPLTAAQAALLDAHFLVEHPARAQAGLFFNFNGTAGVWRRNCIADAGGWSDDTVTEDLDLSYRAQLKGWRFAYDHRVVAPAEVPTDMEALKSQQRRWTRGAIQTARKLLPVVWRSPLPAAVKLEATFHLTGNAAYPLALALGLLLLPVLLAPSSLPAALGWAIQALVAALGVIPVLLFLAVGRREAGAGLAETVRDVPAALILGIGLSVNNARAVLAGLSRRAGAWERTPKTGDTDRAPARGHRYPSARGLAGGAELLLAAWFVAVGVFAWRADHHGAVPFAALLVAGLGSVGLGSLRASLAQRPR
ncbi:MAG TPA: glycosyltransferase [Candidatus Eisenbacteria bacterium]|nr:glycosyltransferase [Candidatus Eisenbacteria bacterium]